MNVTKRLSAFTWAVVITAAAITTPATLCAQQPELPAQATPATQTPGIPTPGIPGTPAPATLPGATPAADQADPAALPGQATPAAPVPATITPFGAPPTAGVSSEARQRAFDPVRQAIARRDFPAAQQALNALRQQYPNDPALATFEASIQAGMNRGGTAPSLIPTPRTSVTPLPTVTPTPSPTPDTTPAIDSAPADVPADTGTQGGIMQRLQDNPIAMYALYGVGAAILLFILFALFRRKQDKPATVDTSEEVTPTPGTLPAVGTDTFDLSSTSGIDSLHTPPATDFSTMTDTGAGASATSSPATDAAPEFTAFGFDDDDQEEAPPKPAFTPRPTPAEDDMPLNFDETPYTPAADDSPAPEAAPEPTDASGNISFESLGIGTPASEPVEPAPAQPTGGTSTPTAGLTPGEVNLDDIFGNQTPPSAADDDNSTTMPTFVSQPGVENPEEHVEIPGKGMRQASDDDQELHIPLDELFGSKDDTPKPEPTAPAPPPAADEDTSLEDALAAAVSDMEAMDSNPPGAAPASEQPPPPSDESLDERTERMFNEQMEKARTAIAQKDWKQAVHVLSIASALHPEHDEARQLLREARAEKRKAEESV